MKHLFTLACLCFFTLGAKAQAGSLTVSNNTGCTVYYIVRGISAPLCGTPNSSSFIALAPLSSVTYANASMVPGLGLLAGDYITGADLYTSTSACAIFPTLFQVGEPCTGRVLAASYQVYNASCTFCRAVPTNVNWVAAGFPGGVATLSFN
ncbi:MAG: hypothetical protein QM743_10165 [Chitinophagaceae bacterium]